MIHVRCWLNFSESECLVYDAKVVYLEFVHDDEHAILLNGFFLPLAHYFLNEGGHS